MFTQTVLLISCGFYWSYEYKRLLVGAWGIWDHLDPADIMNKGFFEDRSGFEEFCTLLMYKMFFTPEHDRC